MARTLSERITFWENLRDSVEDALAASAPVVRYRIGAREVQREPTSAWLREIEQRLEDLQAEDNAASGPARNRAVLKRKP